VDLFREARDFPGTLAGRATVLTSAAMARAGVTPEAAEWRADHGGLTRMHRGVYLSGVAEPDLLDRIHAAQAVCSPRTVVGFHSAAALLGFGVVEDDRVHVVVAPDEPFPQQPTIRVHRAALPVTPVVRRGVACTSAARTAIDLARTVPRDLALATLDAALFSRTCTATTLAAEVARHRGLPGYVRAKSLVARADGLSQCTQESQLRLIIHDAGLVSFVPQVEIRHRGVKKYVLDLADVHRRVAAEYDGASHALRVRQDRERHNWLDERGWRMRYFTDIDLYQRPEKIVRDLRIALADRPSPPARR
jgi:very-short-patch-repair endonuclease